MTFSWSHPTLHLGPLVLGAGLIAWYLEATWKEGFRATSRQRASFVAGAVLLILILSWPLADLALHVSLLLLVLQRLALVLGVAPLLLFGIPPTVAARLTRPPILDFLARTLSRPLVALGSTTALLAVTALPFSVEWAQRSIAVRFLMLALVFLAGVILWLPVIDRVPGVQSLKPMVIAAYLVGQAVAPTFLSFIWIFALRPLYGSLSGQHDALGLSPLTDQQLAGYFAKLVTFGILLPATYVIMVRADEDTDESTRPLHWIDVEREFERAQRRERSGRTGD